MQVVCGAPNVRVGMRCPRADGAVLPGGMVIRRHDARRGAPGHAVLGARTRAVGRRIRHCRRCRATRFPAWTCARRCPRRRADHDQLTPNRPDCLSVAGIAREVAAITALLELPSIVDAPVTSTATRGVRIEDAEAVCASRRASSKTSMRVRRRRPGMKPRTADALPAFADRQLVARAVPGIGAARIAPSVDRVVVLDTPSWGRPGAPAPGPLLWPRNRACPLIELEPPSTFHAAAEAATPKPAAPARSTSKLKSAHRTWCAHS